MYFRPGLSPATVASGHMNNVHVTHARAHEEALHNTANEEN